MRRMFVYVARCLCLRFPSPANSELHTLGKTFTRLHLCTSPSCSILISTFLLTALLTDPFCVGISGTRSMLIVSLSLFSLDSYLCSAVFFISFVLLLLLLLFSSSREYPLENRKSCSNYQTTNRLDITARRTNT